MFWGDTGWLRAFRSGVSCAPAPRGSGVEGDAAFLGAGLDGVDQPLRQAHVQAGGFRLGLPTEAVEGGIVEVGQVLGQERLGVGLGQAVFAVFGAATVVPVKLYGQMFGQNGVRSRE